MCDPPSITADDASYFDSRFAKVEQQANTQPGGLEVVHALGGMDFIKRPDGFELHEDVIGDEHVSDILANDSALVSDRNRVLLRDAETGAPQFVDESILVDLFDKSSTKDVADNKAQPMTLSVISSNRRSSAFIGGFIR